MFTKDDYKNSLNQSLDNAHGLDFNSYTSKEIYDLEVESIFKKDWLFACSELEIPNPGDYKVLTILNESITIIRQKDNSVKALLNYCRHRGTKILDDGVGSTKSIVCPYHAWTYSADGSLKGVPFSGDVEVKKKEHCLKEFSVETWQSLVFIAFSKPNDSIAKRYEGIDSYLKAFDSERFKYGLESTVEHWNCNWKLALENAMESYHLFAVHKETLEKSTPTKKAFYIEGGREWTLTGGEIIDQKKGLASLFSNKEHDYLYNYILISLPPTFVGILTYDSFGWIQILPEAVDRIQVHSGGVTNYKGKTPGYIRDFVQKFFKEDEEICERMQISMNSSHGKGGKLVDLERILVDFRHYIGNRVFKNQSLEHHISENASIFPK